VSDETITVELPVHEAEALAYPLTQPNEETRALAQAARERISAKLQEHYRVAKRGHKGA
jgi:hypothetical protein